MFTMNARCVRVCHFTELFTETFFVAACRGGNLELCKWLLPAYAEKYAGRIIPCRNAARYNHKHILEWLFSLDTVTDSTSARASASADGAAAGGHIELLEWLYNTHG